MSKQLQDILIEFLNADEQSPEDGPFVIDEFTEAMTTLWAAKQTERSSMKAHFAKLDKSYGSSVDDIIHSHENFDDKAMADLMKAALDDVDEHSPEDIHGFDTRIIPDDVIRDFLKGED